MAPLQQARSPTTTQMRKNYLSTGTGYLHLNCQALSYQHRPRMENPSGKSPCNSSSPLTGHQKALVMEWLGASSLRALHGSPAGDSWQQHSSMGFQVGRAAMLLSLTVPPATNLPFPPHAVRNGRRGEKSVSHFIMDECSSFQEGERGSNEKVLILK